jgi:hypothetical protein
LLRGAFTYHYACTASLPCPHAPLSSSAVRSTPSKGAVQVPKVPTIKWGEWVFSMVSGAIVSKTNDQETIPYNYIVFRVTSH